MAHGDSETQGRTIMLLWVTLLISLMKSMLPLPAEALELAHAMSWVMC